MKEKKQLHISLRDGGLQSVLVKDSIEKYQDF